MKHVTVNELADILLSFETVKGMSIIAHVTQMTEISNMRKTGNPYLGTKKLTSGMKIYLNTDFEKGVHNRLKKEDKPVELYKKGKNTMPLVFGDNNEFIGMFLSEETGQYEYVLQYRPDDNTYPNVRYFFEGKEIAKELVAPFIPAPYVPKNQGTDKPVPWRKVYLKNVLNLNFNNEQYVLIHK